MNTNPVANMQQLVSHWRELQAPKSSHKKRGRGREEEHDSRTKLKTQVSTHTDVVSACASETLQTPSQNR